MPPSITFRQKWNLGRLDFVFYGNLNLNFFLFHIEFLCHDILLLLKMVNYENHVVMTKLKTVINNINKI